MSHDDHSPNLKRMPAAAAFSKLNAVAFCPHFGLMPDSSAQFTEDMRCLLGRRLRVAVSILFGGALMFLIRNAFWSAPSGVAASRILMPHVALVSVLGALTVLLSVKSCLSMRALRTCELVIFGLPAAFFVWAEFCVVCHTSPQTSPLEIAAAARAFPAETTIRWMILINVYGIFIPNNWRRAARVVGMMALVPIVAAVVAAVQQPAVHAYLLQQGGLSAMTIWIAIAAVTATYGAHRFGALRRVAFDAERQGVYTLREKLGSGGMGDVYLAEHRLLKRACAIKLIRSDKANDPTAIARFESEVRATAKLTHPNTVEIYDFGHTNDGMFYYAMEFLPGLNLQELVERFGPLPAERVVYLLRQVCSALQEAHAAGLVHRDIKPGNIFAAERGGLYDVAKLLDFGLVKSAAPDEGSLQLTIDGAVVGSPLYSCPEAAVGETLDERSDIYSLGATAFYLLTGRPVFDGDNALKVIFAHANETPPALAEVNPEVPCDLEAVVMKCLQKKREDRFAAAGLLEAALRSCRSADDWTQDRAAQWWTQTAEGPTGVVADASVTDTVTATLIAGAGE
jgi:serine/threonine-protein kinase